MYTEIVKVATSCQYLNEQKMILIKIMMYCLQCDTNEKT
jgi:hypothetical protein